MLPPGGCLAGRDIRMLRGLFVAAVVCSIAGGALVSRSVRFGHLHAPRDPSAAAHAEAELAAVNESDAGGIVSFELLRATDPGPPPTFPRQLIPLDGTRVRIRGFMSPFDSLGDMRQCMLFPFATGCYFCAPPSPVEVAFVRVESLEPVPFEPGAIEIEGTLDLWKDSSPDPAHQAFLYVIDGAMIRRIGDKR